MLIDAGAAEHVAIGGDGIEQRQGADRALDVFGDLGVVDIHVRLLGEPVKIQFKYSAECLETREGLLEGRTGLGLLLAIEAKLDANYSIDENCNMIELATCTGYRVQGSLLESYSPGEEYYLIFLQSVAGCWAVLSWLAPGGV